MEAAGLLAEELLADIDLMVELVVGALLIKETLKVLGSLDMLINGKGWVKDWLTGTLISI